MNKPKTLIEQIQGRRDAFIPHARIIDPAIADELARECNEANQDRDTLLGLLRECGELVDGWYKSAKASTLTGKTKLGHHETALARNAKTNQGKGHLHCADKLKALLEHK